MSAYNILRAWIKKVVFVFLVLFSAETLSGCVSHRRSKLRKRKKIYLILESHLPNTVHKEIVKFWDWCGFDDTKRLIHFLAQCAHESGNFVNSKELLNFALNRERVLKLFNKRLSGRESQLDEYYDKLYKNELSVEELKLLVAELVYGQRDDLGNINEGDGKLFIGRGYIQLTGRNNYTAFTNFLKQHLSEMNIDDIDCVANPELVELYYPMLSAIWYFHHKDVFQICSKGLDDDTITEVTIIVNGKTNGLRDRIKLTRHYENLLKEYL